MTHEPLAQVEMFIELAARAEARANATTDPKEAAIDKQRADRFMLAAVRIAGEAR